MNCDYPDRSLNRKRAYRLEKLPPLPLFDSNDVGADFSTAYSLPAVRRFTSAMALRSCGGGGGGCVDCFDWLCFCTNALSLDASV